jgi:hypothetical protein
MLDWYLRLNSVDPQDHVFVLWSICPLLDRLMASDLAPETPPTAQVCLDLLLLVVVVHTMLVQAQQLDQWQPIIWLSWRLLGLVRPESMYYLLGRQWLLQN